VDEAAPTVEIWGASKSLPGQPEIIDGVNLSVARGESVAILGRSGAGKSTFLSVLGFLDSFDQGTYVFAGEDVSSFSAKHLDRIRGTQVGFVFQRFALFPHLSALENVMVPLRHSSRLSERGKRSAAFDGLESVEMSAAWRRAPTKLSGGEQQRIAIARALVHKPRLILADEPTGSLDSETGAIIVRLLRHRVVEEGASLVVVTHEREIASAMDRTLRLQKGKIEDAGQVP